MGTIADGQIAQLVKHLYVTRDSGGPGLNSALVHCISPLHVTLIDYILKFQMRILNLLKVPVLMREIIDNMGEK